MSKRTHKQQLQRARQRRRTDKFERRRRRTRLIALIAAGLMAFSLVGLALVNIVGAGQDAPAVEDVPDDGQAAGGDAEACPPADDAPEPEPMEFPGEPELQIDTDATYVATVDTTCGEILFELDAAGAPRTVNSFVFLAQEGYFAGAPFHRVIPGFVIQGGDPTGTGAGGPGYTFDDELELAEEVVAEEGGYPRGKVVMANAGPDTNGSQFFVTLDDLGERLPPAYALFGEVIDGMDVVDRIASGPTQGEMAVDPVRIRSVTIDAS